MNSFSDNQLSTHSLTPSLTTNRFVRHHRQLIRFGYHCFDRMLCLARIPAFLNMGAVVRFLKDQRGADKLTPALFRQISSRVHDSIVEHAQNTGVDIVDAPKEPNLYRHEWVLPYYRKLEERLRRSRSASSDSAFSDSDSDVASDPTARGMGVAVILKARESARVIVSDKSGHLDPAYRHVALYNIYLHDPQCGRLFVRLCPYFPFNVQVCLNGHEWLAQQLAREGIGFRKVDNAFLDCDDPRRLQELADAFGPDDISQLVDRVLSQWFHYFTPEEREQGFRHQAYMAQLEYCDNLVFHQSTTVHRLFDRLLDLNRGIGHPDKLAVIFGRPRFRPDTRSGQTVITMTRLRLPVIKSSFKHTSLKQYVKSNVLLRTEATVFQLDDLSLRKAVTHLDHARKALHQSNQRYLDVQQDVLGTFIDRDHLQRLRQPTVSASGRRTPGLRIDDPRLLALWQALTCFVHLVGHVAFRTKDLLPDVRRALNQPDYKLSQLRYDLGKLRGKGLVQRLPNSHRYRLTPEAFRLAIVYTKIYHRLLAPLTTSLLEPLPTDNLLLNRRQEHLDRLYRTLHQSLEKITALLGLAA